MLPLESTPTPSGPLMPVAAPTTLLAGAMLPAAPGANTSSAFALKSTTYIAPDESNVSVVGPLSVVAKPESDMTGAIFPVTFEAGEKDNIVPPVGTQSPGGGGGSDPEPMQPLKLIAAIN